MIRRTFLVTILLVVFSLIGAHSVRAADPYGSAGGSLEQTPSRYPGTTGYPGAAGSFPGAQGDGSSRESTTPSMEAGISPPLPPLPPEGQSAFEQMVSGKVEITRSQFEVIIKDPKIRFMDFMGATLPGTILVPVKIIPDPEKKGFRPIQPTGRRRSCRRTRDTWSVLPTGSAKRSVSWGSAVLIRSLWI